MHENIEIFLNRCRACAAFQENMEKMVELFCEKNVSEMFTNCTSLEISSHDYLPSRICFQCYENLTNLNKFRQGCLNSDRFLREQLVTGALKVERIEDVDIKQEEEEELVPNFESEFHETESVDEGSSHFDPDLMGKTTEENISHDDSVFTNNVAAIVYADDVDPFDSTKFICDICGQQFDQKSYLGSHMTKHKNEITGKPQTKIFICEIGGCIEPFKNKRSLEIHQNKKHKIKIATREKQKKLSCQRCSKKFLTKVNLDAHIRVVHEGLKPYKCPHCEKEFGGIRAYKRHLMFKHEALEKKFFPCTYAECDKQYTVSESLRAHIIYFHLGAKRKKNDQNLVCEQCGRVFKSGSKLKEHTYKHIGVLPFACETCPKTFLTKYQLKLHTMRHLNIKPFVCPTCGMRKTTNKELEAHLNFHTKEKTYPCKECPRVFSSVGAISRHVRIHHRNHKPYICPHCQRAFSKAETMKNHVMTHTGEKPFACSVCGHRFIQSVALRTHMKVHAKKSSVDIDRK